MKNQFIVVISSIIDDETDYIIHGELDTFSSPEDAIQESRKWNLVTNKLRFEGDESIRANQYAMSFMVNEDNPKYSYI
tara:strand:- start:274 stop:507 length:234 start_codon:yes stop_codon:yes gene_type:complete